METGAQTSAPLISSIVSNILPFGIDLDHFKNGDRKKARKRFDIKDDEPLAVALQQQSFARYRSTSFSHKLCAQIQVPKSYRAGQKLTEGINSFG